MAGQGAPVIPPLERAFAPATVQQQAPGQDAISARVATYNILSNKYSGHNSYCPAQYLGWRYRNLRQLQELDAVSADVLCLQEVDKVFYERTLAPHMKARGYVGLFRARQVGPVAGLPEGVALFWRDAMFDLSASMNMDFIGAKPSAIGLPDAIASTGTWQALQRYHEGAIIALLRHRTTGRRLLASATHLHWDPKEPHLKVLQAAILAHAITSFASSQGLDPNTTPCVLGGDFNSLERKYLPDPFDPEIPETPGYLISGVYELTSSGRLPPQHADHPHRRAASQEEAQAWQGVTLQLPYAFSSAMKLANGSEPPLTTRTRTFAGTLDYIWLHGGGSTQPAVPATLRMPYEAAEQWRSPLNDVAMVAVPNEHYPSDHLLVAADVML